MCIPFLMDILLLFKACHPFLSVLSSSLVIQSEAKDLVEHILIMLRKDILEVIV